MYMMFAPWYPDVGTHTYIYREIELDLSTSLLHQEQFLNLMKQFDHMTRICYYCDMHSMVQL